MNLPGKLLLLLQYCKKYLITQTKLRCEFKFAVELCNKAGKPTNLLSEIIKHINDIHEKLNKIICSEAETKIMLMFQ
jgi:hypothetical protein